MGFSRCIRIRLVAYVLLPPLTPHGHRGATSAVVSQALGLPSNTTIYIAGGKPHEVFEHSNEAFDTTRALFPDSQFPKVRCPAPVTQTSHRDALG